MLKNLNQQQNKNSITLMRYLANIPIETLIVTPIVEILIAASWENFNFQKLELEIEQYYKKNSRINADELKNKIALILRVKLFEIWKDEFQQNITEQVKQKINTAVKDISTKKNIMAHKNLFGILLQLTINTNKEIVIVDKDGNDGTVIWISPTCVFVILSVAGTFVASYYLSNYPAEELYQQISTLWNWIRNWGGIIPMDVD
ncbi:MAG: hypothetical protein ABIA74_01670 [bacterium]